MTGLGGTAGAAPGSNGTRSCAPTFSDASFGDVRPNRSPASWPGRKAGRSSPMRVPTGSSTGSPRGGRTMTGDATCRGGSGSGGDGAGRGEARPPSSVSEDPSLSVPSRPRTVRPAGIGKRTRCSSADQGRWCGPCTSATRACCSRCGRLRRLRGRLPRPSPGCWDRCRRCFARRCVGALSAGSCSIGVTTTRPALAPSPPSSPERPACRPRPVPALLAAVRASPAQ